jgi:stress-induced-phosphoprotein 1
MLNSCFGIEHSQGLNELSQAVEAWTRALSVLPVDSLTPAEKKQRDQYSSELAAAKAKLEEMKANPKNPEGVTTLSPSEHDKLPWKRAAAIIPGLIASNTWNSSVRCFYIS